MVREITVKAFDYDQQYIQYAGLSTDTKPTEGLVTGSTFVEVDTGKVYLFDEVTSTWREM